MNKHFVFVEDGWWDDNGCDCCGGYYMENYTCTSHDGLYGNSTEDCLSSILYHIDESRWSYDVLDGMSDSQVKDTLQQLGITYELDNYNTPEVTYYAPLDYGDEEEE